MRVDIRKYRVLNFRPMVLLALCMALGIGIGRFLSYSAVYIIVAAVLGVAAICLHKKQVFALVCAAMALLGVFVSANAADVDYIDTNEDMHVSGRVASRPDVTDYGSLVFIIDQAEIDGEKTGGVKVYADIEEPIEVRVGDVIETNAKVALPKGVRNPGGFDERLYLKTQGVHYKAYADFIVTNGERGGFMIWSVKASEYIGSVVDSIFDKDTAPTAKAMLLGDKRDLSEQTYDAYKDTGMAHILAVSGLHAGILIAFVYFSLRLLRAGEGRGRLSRLLSY